LPAPLVHTSTLFARRPDSNRGRQAAGLLKGAGRHGHRHALDAIVAATALDAGARPIVYTSDPDDFHRLLPAGVTVVPLV